MYVDLTEPQLAALSQLERADAVHQGARPHPDGGWRTASAGVTHDREALAVVEVGTHTHPAEVFETLVARGLATVDRSYRITEAGRALMHAERTAAQLTATATRLRYAADRLPR